MSFADSLKRLRAVADGDPAMRTRLPDQLLRRDLAELLHHFDRLDSDARAAALSMQSTWRTGGPGGALVRVCEISDAECSRGCNVGPCVRAGQTPAGVEPSQEPPELTGLARGFEAMKRAAAGVEPCPRGEDRPEPTCTNRHQCWEPCGELGKSEEHARAVGVDTSRGGEHG
jgi:hypothetical protein